MSQLARVLIADDEGPARQRLMSLLRRHPDIELVGECKDGEELDRMLAEAAASLAHIEVVFLDVHLPGVNGIDLFEALADKTRYPLPVFIFVTADERHAAHAMQIGAADYLLKPFTDERFEAALKRAMAARYRGASVTSP